MDYSKGNYDYFIEHISEKYDRHIRYYGLFANRVIAQKIPLTNEALALTQTITITTHSDMPEVSKRVFGT